MPYINKDRAKAFISDDAAPEWQAKQRLEWVDELFATIGTPQESWSHVHPVAMGCGGTIESPNLVNMRILTETYDLNQDWHRPLLDWLVADALCYAEVNQTLITFGWPDWVRLGKIRWFKIAWLVVSKVISWGIWLFIAAFLANCAWWAVAVWILLTAWSVWASSKRNERRRQLLMAMIDAYETLDATNPSWSITFDALKKARDLGAKWPTELYHLVEARLR